MSLELPRVTVVMPVRDEEASIGRSLGAVLDQDYPADLLEVIVADGGSTDATRELAAELARRRPEVSVDLIDNPQGIVPSGLNLAIRRAGGEVIVRVDGHTEIEADYVRECVSELRRTGADNVGGRMVATGTTTFGRAVALATSSRFGIGGSRFHYHEAEAWVDTVYLGAWRRETFERVGLFDEDLVRNQDDEWNFRLRSGGGRIFLSPRIRSSYLNRSTPGRLWRQYFQYGWWKIRVLQKHPRQMAWHHFVPAFLVTVLVTAALAACFSTWGALVLAGALGTYALACLGASWSVAVRRGGRSFFPVLLAFPILHLSYGLGFSLGMVRFAFRWSDRHGTVPRLEVRSS